MIILFQVAEVMNEHFVNIKVDREERPDVDKVYMTFIQASVGGGGWPMSIFMTPTLKPIFGGTYFPPRDGFGRPGKIHFLGKNNYIVTIPLLPYRIKFYRHLMK